MKFTVMYFFDFHYQSLEFIKNSKPVNCACGENVLSYTFFIPSLIKIIFSGTLIVREVFTLKIVVVVVVPESFFLLQMFLLQEVIVPLK